MMIQRGVGEKHQTVLNLALDRGEWSAANSRCFTPGERSPIPILYENGWIPKSVWMWWKRNPCQCQELNPSHSVCSHTLYWLSFPSSFQLFESPGSTCIKILLFIWKSEYWDERCSIFHLHPHPTFVCTFYLNRLFSLYNYNNDHYIYLILAWPIY
jgi:hypothetical protein